MSSLSAPALDLPRFTCVPYSPGQPDGERFYVRAPDKNEALRQAASELTSLGHTNVFMEDDCGQQVFDGPISMAPA